MGINWATVDDRRDVTQSVDHRHALDVGKRSSAFAFSRCELPDWCGDSDWMFGWSQCGGYVSDCLSRPWFSWVSSIFSRRRDWLSQGTQFWVSAWVCSGGLDLWIFGV